MKTEADLSGRYPHSSPDSGQWDSSHRDDSRGNDSHRDDSQADSWLLKRCLDDSRSYSSSSWRGDSWRSGSWHSDGHQQEVSDHEIVLLLVSRKEAKQDRGLRLVFRQKERRVCGFLRRDCLSFLSPWDILDIWAQVMSEFAIKVRMGEFSAEGKLNSLLLTMARNKAIDLLRYRRRWGNELDSGIGAPPDGKSQTQPPYMFNSRLRDYAKALAKQRKLTEAETMVFVNWTMLLLCEGDEPSNSKLLHYVNVERKAYGEDELSEIALKALKHRAFAKLQGTQCDDDTYPEYRDDDGDDEDLNQDGVERGNGPANGSEPTGKQGDRK